MPLASSGSVNLTTVRDYYGSSSNNLTALYKGGSFVPNPTSYNSGTQTTNAANANANVPTSGSISLTDFRGGRKLVTNATVTVDASGITQSGDNGDRQWVGVKTNSDYWYRSGYNVNYASIAGVANEAQLLFVNRWSLAGNTCSFSIPFTVNVAGEYYLYAVVSGPGGAGATLNFTGSGVSSGGVTNQSMGSGTTQVLTPVLTANTTVTVSMTSGTSGGAGDNISIHFRTNCNADTSNIGGNAGNNYSLM